MLSLLKIKGMLDQISVSERKLANFILDNSNLLRDYSSQQLADAVGVSQSSVVKFCQKLGYKGYPDLKLSITEAVVTATTLQREQTDYTAAQGSLAQLAETLQLNLQQSLRNLLSINPEEQLQLAAQLLHKADKVLLAGTAQSALVAMDMQYRLLELGKLALFQADPMLNLQLLSTLDQHSVLFLISDSGQQTELLRLEQYAKERHVKIISLSCFQTNAQSVVADATLFTLTADADPLSEHLIRQQAQQHLCHLLYLLLSQRPAYRQQHTTQAELANLLA